MGDRCGKRKQFMYREKDRIRPAGSVHVGQFVDRAVVQVVVRIERGGIVELRIVNDLLVGRVRDDLGGGYVLRLERMRIKRMVTVQFVFVADEIVVQLFVVAGVGGIVKLRVRQQNQIGVRLVNFVVGRQG